MKIVLFTHPDFLKHQSMPRFARMIEDGMKRRGHQVEIWTSKRFFILLPLPGQLRKWLGYIDQYLIFPLVVKLKLFKSPSNTLFVFTDQALGPWVPLVKNRPHVIHCHDFLAQYSANGAIPENKTSWTGKQYQLFIRNGYKKGKNFISVSKKTRKDLHDFLTLTPNISEVVYNGVNPIFKHEDILASRSKLQIISGINLLEGYLLHVGGNQWYKNRIGVIEIFNAWRSVSKHKLPLLMIGEKPNTSLLKVYQQSPYKTDIYFLSSIKDEHMRFAYAGASLFLFPSLAEGFGWPIAEAMACGSQVLTTNEAPMSEVAGDAAYLVPKRFLDSSKKWAKDCVEIVEEAISISQEKRGLMINKSILNASRFDQTIALNKIEEVYKKVLQGYLIL